MTYLVDKVVRITALTDGRVTIVAEAAKVVMAGVLALLVLDHVVETAHINVMAVTTPALVPVTPVRAPV